MPLGVIVQWSGAIDAIPNGWVQCDGANGTPDLRGKLLVAANDEHRRDIEVTRHGPGGPAIERILVEHADEARRIADGDAWEHGYWAGTLSFARLMNGLAQVDDVKLYDGQCSDDEDDPPIRAADVRAAALADYPVLDS